jgi:CDP-diacylglycerol---glycerol-3-phosphate 3-phosphatidyltransferase
VLRVVVGSQQHVVIAASGLGKAKTVLQVAMVICVIAVHGKSLWLELLIYATVLVTVLSGADCFFGRSVGEPGRDGVQQTSSSQA